MSTAICLGGGEIGRLGIQDLLDEGARVLLVDPDENCSARLLCDRSVCSPDAVLESDEGEVLYLKGDGPAVLADVLHRWTPSKIVPAAPGHLAARLAMAWANRTYRRLHPFGGSLLRVVDMLPPGTVQMLDSANGVLVASNMPSGMACRIECGQPSVCPVTGNENPTPMYCLIDKALVEAADRRSVLVTSGTRVGVLQGESIREMLDVLNNMEGGMTIAIATSCRCHAIVNMFRLGGN